MIGLHGHQAPQKCHIRVNKPGRAELPSSNSIVLWNKPYGAARFWSFPRTANTSRPTCSRDSSETFSIVSASVW